MQINFLEYLILAIFITLLYSLSAMEILIRRHKNASEELSQVEFSAGWAIAGIFATLVCGFLAKMNVQLPFPPNYMLLVPAAFIGKWLHFYVSNSQAAGGVSKITLQIDNEYKALVLDVLRRIKYGDILFVPPGEGSIYNKEFADLPAIFYFTNESLKQKEVPLTFMRTVSAVGRKKIELLGFDFLYDMMSFDLKRLERILMNMEGTNVDLISFDKHLYFRLNDLA